MNILEISVSTSEEAIIAQKGGADRLEVAIKSDQGGLTPDMIQISEVLSHSILPCYILIRPRVDSYELTEEEFQQLLHIIEIAKLSTAKGISIGLLRYGKIDRKRLEKVIAVKGHLELVFNHAIDSTYCWDEEIKYLIENEGVDWIQTTGSTETIIDGYRRILPLMKDIKNKLIVGRAINSENIYKLLDDGIRDVVFQCRTALNIYDGFDNSLSLEKLENFSKILKEYNNEKNKLEVIAWSLDDAIKIYKAGADRIELVADLTRGGLTPSLDLVKQVVQLVDIPVRVMVRETDESFVYDESTMIKHIEYVEKLRDIKPEGIVFGSITNEGKINFDQLESIIKVKGDMKLTFHRAFDELDIEDFEEEFDKLSNYDVDTILTSGTCVNAWEGRDNLKKLIEKGTINILPGKSISIHNAKDIINYTNANFVHVGYSVRDIENETGNIDENKIKELINSINS